MQVFPHFLSAHRPVTSLHVIQTGSFYRRRDPVRGKAILEIRCHQFSPTCAR